MRYPGLSRWAQPDHLILKSENPSQSEERRRWDNGQREAKALAFKMEDGAISQRK